MKPTVEDKAMTKGFEMRVAMDAAHAQVLAHHGYRPLYLERFPWRCAATHAWGSMNWKSLVTNSRCVLVEGHEGNHEGAVEWA